ncbi:AMP-binding protein [Gordonia otitidis]|uniref:class I adenylate-forming enzyme family protein n=1 Tax=Gordonia otitidis TaxID=249058 RepID=UPI001D152E93|nr:AMP-binding protein [Gordonia otitidis]UEA57374.1 AMP-binding protein [Gordonia otitidis]
MDILAAFDSAATKFPTKEVLITGEGDSLTYAELVDQSRRAATVFAGHGLTSGDRIALMCYNTTGFVIAMLGAWRVGATIVPINHKLAPPEVAHIIGHSGSSLLVVDGSLHAGTEGIDVSIMTTDTSVPDVPHLEDAVAAATPLPAAEQAQLADDTIAEILYTSGTTGLPKGCVHTHRTVTLTAMTAVIGLSMTRDERLLMSVPIWHASPLNNWLLGTLYVGGTVVLQREYHPVKFLDTAAAQRITLCFGPPVIYTTALNSVPDFADYDLSSARAWLYGGGPIGPEVAQRLAAGYRSDNFFQVYGMTETGPVGSVLYPDEQVSKAGSIGRVGLPGVDVRVVSASGENARANQVGEIWIRSATTMIGYLDDPEATRAAIDADGWYHTGDLARVDDDGYLFIVDRTKDMIITGGENVYSKEVEDALTAHPAIAEAAVVGRPHPEWGQTVIAHLVRIDGADDVPEDLTTFLADRLARYKIPREFHVAQSLPRTPTGKIQKHLINTPELSTTA